MILISFWVVIHCNCQLKGVGCFDPLQFCFYVLPHLSPPPPFLVESDPDLDKKECFPTTLWGMLKLCVVAVSFSTYMTGYTIPLPCPDLWNVTVTPWLSLLRVKTLCCCSTYMTGYMTQLLCPYTCGMSLLRPGMLYQCHWEVRCLSPN